MNDHCIDTHMSLLAFYAELRPDQIKRVLTFFHRIFVKRKQQVILYRLDVCELLSRMVNDEVNIPQESSIRKHLEDFVKHYSYSLIKALKKTPALYVEVKEFFYNSHRSYCSPNYLVRCIICNTGKRRLKHNRRDRELLLNWKFVQDVAGRIRLLLLLPHYLMNKRVRHWIP